MNKGSGGSRKTLKAITLETGQVMQRQVSTDHTVQQTISCTMSEKILGVNLPRALHHDGVAEKEHLTRLLVSARMNQHSSRDAVTEWTCLGSSMHEDDAVLNDDDSSSPPEQVDATADETIKEEWP